MKSAYNFFYKHRLPRRRLSARRDPVNTLSAIGGIQENEVETGRKPSGNPDFLPKTEDFARISPPHGKTRRKDPKGWEGTDQGQQPAIPQGAVEMLLDITRISHCQRERTFRNGRKIVAKSP